MLIAVGLARNFDGEAAAQAQLEATGDYLAVPSYILCFRLYRTHGNRSRFHGHRGLPSAGAAQRQHHPVVNG